MNHKHARLFIYSIPALLIGLLLACGVGSSDVKGDVSAPSPTGAGLDRAPQTAPSQAAQGATYYVRTDGGSADECTGQTDAAYPGSGTSQPCA